MAGPRAPRQTGDYIVRSQAMLAAAVLAFSSFALPAKPAAAQEGYYRDARPPISEQCRDNRKSNTTKGALLGGAIGAAGGAGAAGRGSRGTGALIGGALGAGIGALAGRGATSCDNYERDGYYGRDNYGRDDYRHDGYRDDGYYRDGRNRYGRDSRDRCHVEDVIRYDRQGRKYRDTVQVCD